MRDLYISLSMRDYVLQASSPPHVITPLLKVLPCPPPFSVLPVLRQVPQDKSISARRGCAVLQDFSIFLSFAQRLEISLFINSSRVQDPPRLAEELRQAFRKQLMRFPHNAQLLELVSPLTELLLSFQSKESPETNSDELDLGRPMKDLDSFPPDNLIVSCSLLVIFVSFDNFSEKPRARRRIRYPRSTLALALSVNYTGVPFSTLNPNIFFFPFLSQG